MKKSAGDVSAEELLQMYSSMIYRVAYAAVQNTADAEDITQNVFLKYITADKSFNSEEHRKAWLLRVTVNCVKDFVKSAYYRRRTDMEKLPETADADETFKAEEAEEAEALRSALQQLPEKYRVPIHLFYYEDMTVAEISAVTKTKEATVKSQLSRGREMLRNILKEVRYEL
ncbi:MAG: sigma-70 family RNA polymerase sigma factor [Firmicutes bacterium]|nr:sigma-70 family RNA polymerase sigma factor [[Eubacterium] siraeum]MCM1489037.1 sigma-70 family RNA polymerase sigma factor [Bacillota bacterium]